MPGLLSKMNEDMTITRKMPNGTTVTVKSPNGSQMSMDGILGGLVEGHTPTPVSDNTTIRVTPGEYVVNQPATQKYKPLLEQINQEGRMMLAQGGWIDKPKPMGYNMGGMIPGYEQGGPFGGYANYNPQQFLGEAARVNTPGAQTPMAAPPTNTFTPTPTVEQQAATAPVSAPVEVPVEAPKVQEEAQTPAQELMNSTENQAVKGITTEQATVGTASATQDEGLARSVGNLFGNADGVGDVLSNLNSEIEKREGKRDKMRTLMYSLALLNGEGFRGAAAAAQSMDMLGKEKLDSLYRQRTQIQDRMTAEYLDKAYPEEIKTAGAVSGPDGPAVGWDVTGLTEAQGKSLSLGNEAITGNGRMTALESTPGFDPREIRSEFTAALLRDKDGNITGLRASVLQKLDPLKAAYMRETMRFVTAKLRKESGAAISATEWATEFEKMVPANPEDFKYAQEYRNRGVKSLANSAGAPTLKDYYIQAGFEGGAYDATPWYDDVIVKGFGVNPGGGSSGTTTTGNISFTRVE